MSMNDLAYQVRAGELMLRTGHVLRHDPFSFASSGSWFDQQWGAQIVFAAVARAGRWSALAVLRAALVGAIASMTYAGARVRGASVRRAALLTLAGCLVAFPGFVLRPQLLGLLLFSAMVLALSYRSRRSSVLLLVPVITLVWANVHGSFVLAPVLVAWAVAFDLGRHDVRPSLLALVGCLGASGVTPFGFAVWRYAADLSLDPRIAGRVQEWGHTTPASLPGVLFLGSVAAAGALLFARRREVPWPDAGLLLVFVLVGAWSIRGIYWWGLLVPVVVALLVPAPAEREEGVRWLNAAVIAAVGAVCVAGLPWLRPLDARLTDAPIGLTDRLARLVGPGDRVFASQVWGSWVEAHLPLGGVFVDSRIELYPAAVWDDYLVASGGRSGWAGVLDRWGIDYVIATTDQDPGLLRRLSGSDDWRLVAADREGALYARG